MVSEVESQVEAASEVTRVISSANVTGTINMMGHDVFTEEELNEELDELMKSTTPPLPPQREEEDEEAFWGEEEIVAESSKQATKLHRRLPSVGRLEPNIRVDDQKGGEEETEEPQAVAA